MQKQPIKSVSLDFESDYRRSLSNLLNSDQQLIFIGNLTQREKEIMILLAKGSRYKEISDSLSISLDTVRSHTQHIYKKLGVRSRTEAVLKIIQAEF